MKQIIPQTRVTSAEVFSLAIEAIKACKKTGTALGAHFFTPMNGSKRSKHAHINVTGGNAR